MADPVFVRGIKFPFQRVGTQLPSPTTNEVTISESLRQLISTAKLTRIMRPDFGTNIMSYVFENNTALLEENIRTEMATAIAKYEPRILVLAINTKRIDESLIIDIQYVVRATRIQTSESILVPIG